MKKILEFTDTLSDGGAETIIKDYALLIDKSKFDLKIVVIYNFQNTANYRILKEHNIEIIPVFPEWNNKSRILNKFFNTFYISSMFLKIIQTEKPDCIHIHMALLKYFENISTEIRGIKLFYTCHSLPKRYFAGDNRKEFDIAKKLIRENNLKLIALHQDMADELNFLFDTNNTIVIRNGIDYNRFENLERDEANLRSQLGIGENALVLGHIGRFADVKNHQFIIQVFSAIYKQRKDVHLLLIGHGSLKESIVSTITNMGLIEHTTILEHRSDVPQLLKTMDVFLFPSKYEGLGIALIEAQVAGVRCFASDSVPKETQITSLVTYLSLKQSHTYWANYILKHLLCDVEKYPNYNNYNMRREIHRLEELYGLEDL